MGSNTTTKPNKTVVKKAADMKALITSTSTPDAAKRSHLSEVVDTEVINANALLTMVEGSKWTVNYYSQVLTSESAGNNQSFDQDPVHQQYRFIVGMEFKVSTPLDQSENGETGEFQVTGTALTYPGWIPNEGDMFIADVGDGRSGVFGVTNTNRKSMFKDAVFEIEYTMVSYLTVERESDLSNKVVKTEYFNKEFLVAGENPFLDTEQHKWEKDLKTEYQRLVLVYHKSFYSRENKTITSPCDCVFYDYFLSNMFSKVISRNDLAGLPEPTLKALGGDINKDVFTLWDMLIRRDKSLMFILATRFRKVKTTEFAMQPYFSSIAMSDINFAIWPMSELTHAEKVCHKSRDSLLDDIANSTDNPLVIYSSPDNIDIYDPDHDPFYVFSKAFYEEDNTKMSALESLTYDYLQHEALSLDTLLRLAKASDEWTPLQRFYFIPVMLILIKVSIKGV